MPEKATSCSVEKPASSLPACHKLTGDEELRIATDYLLTLDYWKMKPDNSLVAGSKEAYCLAEPGKRYTVYAPKGGTVKLDLRAVAGSFEAHWLDPRAGGFTLAGIVPGGAEATLEAPDPRDWVLDVALRQSKPVARSSS